MLESRQRSEGAAFSRGLHTVSLEEFMRLSLCVFDCLLLSAIALAQTGGEPKAPPAGCPQEIDVNGDKPLTAGLAPPSAKKCQLTKKNGFPMPDPKCTPGAINETLTLAVMEETNFTTACVRDRAESSEAKEVTYTWYNVRKPTNNTHENQTCELDHLISLELGGADTLDNIWPQCGPSKVVLNARYFKRKDAVENYLANQVRKGNMTLADAQKAIVADWTQFLAEAEACPKEDCSNP
jgi:hypothetical protein